jgi:hypothetical protein
MAGQAEQRSYIEITPFFDLPTTPHPPKTLPPLK